MKGFLLVTLLAATGTGTAAPSSISTNTNPTGTTAPAAVAWHSPAGRMAYGFAHRAANAIYRTGAAGTYAFDAAAVAVFDARIETVFARIGADAFAIRYGSSVRPIGGGSHTVDVATDAVPTVEPKRASRNR